MLYEVRIYAIPPGREDDIAVRMLSGVPALFRAHGIHAVAHWAALSGPNLPAFIYVLEWADAAAREAGWARFYADERWWRIRAETNAGTELVDRYGLWLMRPNAAWTPPFIPLSRPDASEVHELLVMGVAIGQAGEVARTLGEELIPGLQRAGGRVLALWDMVAGPVVPTTALIVAWTDTATWAASRRILGQAQLSVLGRRDSYLLLPLNEYPDPAELSQMLE